MAVHGDRILPAIQHCVFVRIGKRRAPSIKHGCYHYRWNAQDIVLSYGVDETILGMASQICERDDNIIVSDLRDFSFGPMHFTRLDLAAMDIMRGRDNGLPDYNTCVVNGRNSTVSVQGAPQLRLEGTYMGNDQPARLS